MDTSVEEQVGAILDQFLCYILPVHAIAWGIIF
jgi:hypothetical protein